MMMNFVPGNQVTLLQNGDAYFPAIEAAIDRAVREIFLEAYIFKNDTVGLRITEGLKRAVLRGVSVHIVIDGFGSKDLTRSELDRLQSAGIKVLIYRPKISPWTFQRERLRRMHRKIVVVDQEIAFVGGINVVNDQRGTDGISSQYDFAVAIEGPLVVSIHQSARRLWSMLSWVALRKSAVRSSPMPVQVCRRGEVSAAFLVRDNFHHRRDIEAAYMQAIKRATREIILAHAYFLPGLKFRHALIDAAARGVRVILLLQGRMEYLLEYHASRALYRNFLDAGIEIYEYRKGFLHAKVAVIDGLLATVGSSNIDPFSLLLSREANVVIEDKTFSGNLAQLLKTAAETDSRQVVAKSWKMQPARLRVIGWISYGFLRLMKGISGYDRIFGEK